MYHVQTVGFLSDLQEDVYWEEASPKNPEWMLIRSSYTANPRYSSHARLSPPSNKPPW